MIDILFLLAIKNDIKYSFLFPRKRKDLKHYQIINFYK